jgi:hypothetical protein
MRAFFDQAGMLDVITSFILQTGPTLPAEASSPASVCMRAWQQGLGNPVIHTTRL